MTTAACSAPCLGACHRRAPAIMQTASSAGGAGLLQLPGPVPPLDDQGYHPAIPGVTDKARALWLGDEKAGGVIGHLLEFAGGRFEANPNQYFFTQPDVNWWNSLLQEESGTERTRLREDGVVGATGEDGPGWML